MITNSIKIDIFSILLFILLLLNENFFYLIKNTAICAPIFIILLLVMLIFSGKIYISYEKKQIWKFCLLFISGAFLSFLYTVITELQPFRQAVIKYIPYLGIFFCFPFLNKNKMYRVFKLIRVFETVAIIISILYIIQSLIYPNIVFISTVSYRNGVRIIDGGIMFLLGFLLLLNDFFYSGRKKSQIYYLVCLLIVGYNIIFINQSRSLLLALLISTGVFLYRHFISIIKNWRGKISWYLLIGIITILLIIWVLFYFKEVVASSLEIGESSSIVRLAAYRYYFSLFIEHPILGIGMIRNQIQDGLAQIGVAKRYFVDDIGLIGFIAQWGVLGIIIMANWLKSIIIAIKKNGSVLGWALLSAIIVIMPFNIFFNVGYGIIYSIITLIVIYGNNITQPMRHNVSSDCHKIL